MGLSLREIVAVFELLGIDRSHGAIWHWTHTLAETQSDPPTAVDDHYTVEDGVLSIAAPGVLSNDTDVENDPLAASIISRPSNGSLSLAGNGSITYAPDAGFVGDDQFTYESADGNGGSDRATVSITIDSARSAGSGDSPGTPSIAVANATLSATTVEPGETVSIFVELRNDGDGVHEVSLSVDGSVVSSKRVFLGEGDSSSIPIRQTFEDVGEYAVSVDGASLGSVTVRDESDDPTLTEAETAMETEKGGGKSPDTPGDGTSESPSSQSNVPTTDGSGPGFSAVAAVLALLATALLARRRH